MLTPRQRIFLDDPRLKEIIDRLELEVIPQPEFLIGEKIAQRVEGWINQIAISPIVPRAVEPDPNLRKPWDRVDLSKIKFKDCPF